MEWEEVERGMEWEEVERGMEWEEVERGIEGGREIGIEEEGGRMCSIACA